MDGDMGKATSTRKKKSGGADDALGALEQRQLADFLARAHATLRLWRLCEHKHCRRRRGPRGAAGRAPGTAGPSCVTYSSRSQPGGGAARPCALPAAETASNYESFSA